MVDKEFLFVGGGFLLALLVGPALTFPLFFLTKDPIWTIITGTAVSMGIYAGGCFLYARYSKTTKADVQHDEEIEKELVSTGQVSP